MNRIKPSQVSIVDDHCIYPRSPAYILGLLAAVFLVLAVLIVGLVGGFCTVLPRAHPNSPAASNRSVAITYQLGCWVTYMIALASFIVGAIQNNRRELEEATTGQRCKVAGPWVFVLGSFLALATVGLYLRNFLASCAAWAAAGYAAHQTRPLMFLPMAMVNGPTPLVHLPNPPQNQMPVPTNLNGNAQWSYPYCPFPHPPQNQMHVPPYPNGNAPGSFAYGPFHQPPRKQMHVPTNPNDQSTPAIGYPVFTGLPTAPPAPNHAK